MSPTITYIGLAIAVAVLIVANVPWGKLGGLLPKIGGGESSGNDAADMAAFRLLEARFKRTKCKDGQDAMQVVATHFFHEGA